MKKIGVVTWLGGGNYGTSLQSYALNHKLTMMGYKAYQIVRIDITHQAWLKRNLKTFLISLGLWTVKQHIFLNRLPLFRKKLFMFEKEAYRFKKIYSRRSLNKVIRCIDVFCCGSDQIWNTAYRFDGFMFLDFAKNKKRISYASSIGVKNIPEPHKEKVAALLSRFSHISVREISGVKALKELLPTKDIVSVLDPTFLLNKEEWSDMAHKAKLEFKLPQKYMFCYFVGDRPEYIQQLQDVISKTGNKNVIAVTFQNKKIALKNVFTYYDAGPREFVYLLEHADFVCTDSFHATAMSINFGKNFVEFLRFNDDDSNSQNSRIYDLLSHYGLRQRLYDIENTEWLSDIDYSKVNDKLAKDRFLSEEYLLKAIEE